MDEMQKYQNLKNRIESLTNEKIRIEERYNAGKVQLEKILKEIESKGYDYRKLPELRLNKQAELEKSLSDLENKIIETEEKLHAIEEKQ